MDGSHDAEIHPAPEVAAGLSKACPHSKLSIFEAWAYATGQCVCGVDVWYWAISTCKCQVEQTGYVFSMTLWIFILSYHSGSWILSTTIRLRVSTSRSNVWPTTNDKQPSERMAGESKYTTMYHAHRNFSSRRTWQRSTTPRNHRPTGPCSK